MSPSESLKEIKVEIFVYRRCWTRIPSWDSFEKEEEEEEEVVMVGGGFLRQIAAVR